MTPSRTRSRALLGAVLLSLAARSIGVAQELGIAVRPGTAPGSERWTQVDVDYRNVQGEAMVRNVVRPTLTAYLPARGSGNGTAVIIAPGGGFRFLSWQTEGTQVAEWFQARGVAAFVLRYRLVDTGASEEEFRAAQTRLFAAIRAASGSADPGASINADSAIEAVLPLAIADGRQAMKVIRDRAAEWGIAANRVGLMGFSAGGMVTVGVALADEPASRPSFIAPIYSVPRTPILVPDSAPPMFDLVAADDALAAGPSLALFSEWRAAGRPAELHVYARGGHGFGMIRRGRPVDDSIERLRDWLADLGFLPAAP